MRKVMEKTGKALLGEMIAECLAVMIIVTIGDSVAAMFSLYDPSPYKQAYWGVAITWGLAVTLAIYVTGSVSGTHANPAVTLALACYRGFSWKKVVPYWVAQVGGGFLGASLVYALYGSVIQHYALANHLDWVNDGAASGVFFTHPGDFVTPIHAMMNEVILTAILVLGIFAITCEYNTVAPQANSGALIIGLLVAVLGASSGFLEGWALNPARDLGPRIFCFVAGWGRAAFPSPGNYWWMPIAGPMAGGLVGATLYQTLLCPFMPARARVTTTAAD
ncbi:MIP/aquaporin family protein [Acetobacter ascendens]|nr:MIP/aquaporin family protein [Acetobacter ascendens]